MCEIRDKIIRVAMMSVTMCFVSCTVLGESRPVVSATKKIKLSGTQEQKSVVLDETSGLCMVTGEYVVPKDCELIIQKGVRIAFNMKSGLTVLGKLMVLGTPDSPVIIKGNSSGLNAWDGIKLLRCDESEIAHAHVSGALIALSTEAAKLKIVASTFYRNSQVAEIRERDGGVAFEGCQIVENKKGVHYHYSNVCFTKCTLTDNKEYAITGSYYGDVALDRCLVTRNGFGIQDGGYEGTLQAHHCAIFDNKKFDVKNDSSVPGDFTRNWWGKKNLALLQTKKTAGVKLPKVVGKFVNIAEFLTEVPDDCGAQDCPQKTIK